MVKITMRVFSILAIIGFSVAPAWAQQPNDRWLRVYTGEDSHIELNVDRLIFSPDRVVRVELKTIYAEPQTLANDSKVNYTTRVENVGFRLTGKEFRTYEIKLLATAQVVISYPLPSEEEWRPIRSGGMMDKLFYEVRNLPPFGNWQVVAFRFADDTVDSTTGPPGLRRLIGLRWYISTETIQFGSKSCSSPVYESKTLATSDLSKELGVAGAPLGLKTNSVEAIIIKCHSEGWPSSRSFLFRTAEGNRFMLWDGVFLALKRARN